MMVETANTRQPYEKITINKDNTHQLKKEVLTICNQ